MTRRQMLTLGASWLAALAVFGWWAHDLLEPARSERTTATRAVLATAPEAELTIRHDRLTATLLSMRVMTLDELTERAFGDPLPPSVTRGDTAIVQTVVRITPTSDVAGEALAVECSLALVGRDGVRWSADSSTYASSDDPGRSFCGESFGTPPEPGTDDGATVDRVAYAAVPMTAARAGLGVDLMEYNKGEDAPEEQPTYRFEPRRLDGTDAGSDGVVEAVDDVAKTAGATVRLKSIRTLTKRELESRAAGFIIPAAKSLTGEEIEVTSDHPDEVRDGTHVVVLAVLVVNPTTSAAGDALARQCDVVIRSASGRAWPATSLAGASPADGGRMQCDGNDDFDQRGTEDGETVIRRGYAIVPTQEARKMLGVDLVQSWGDGNPPPPQPVYRFPPRRLAP